MIVIINWWLHVRAQLVSLWAWVKDKQSFKTHFSEKSSQLVYLHLTLLTSTVNLILYTVLLPLTTTFVGFSVAHPAAERRLLVHLKKCCTVLIVFQLNMQEYLHILILSELQAHSLPLHIQTQTLKSVQWENKQDLTALAQKAKWKALGTAEVSAALVMHNIRRCVRGRTGNMSFMHIHKLSSL